jgi:hypothetical protein
MWKYELGDNYKYEYYQFGADEDQEYSSEHD